MTARFHNSDLSLTFTNLAAHLEGFSHDEARAALLRDFQRRWDGGPRPRVEDYLGAWPALAERRELLLDLICQEMLSRQGDGERLDSAEYEARFPDLAAPLRRQLDLLRLIASQETVLPRAAGAEGDPLRLTHAQSPEDQERGSRASAAEPGVSVPGYEVLGLLGKGGMGVVYKARHLRLNRVVALKMVLGGAHATPDQLARFLSEAEALAALQHPNVVQVYDSGQHEGLPFIALEYVPGGSLADRLRDGPLVAKEAARIVELAARGVQAVHDKGIVHRDLKPGNILLAEDGTPKVTDFGLAKRVEDSSGLTVTGAVIGTPSYMAPEQARGEGKQVRAAADVWALGAVLYECQTGRPPFRATTSFETMVHVLGEEPVPVRQLQPG
jgi:serine/threonine-protein kinase